MCMGPILLYGKMLKNSNNFSSEAPGPMMLKCHVKFPWGRGTKSCYNDLGPVNKMVACPIMVKTFKNILLEDRRCLSAESLHKSSGTGDILKLLK